MAKWHLEDISKALEQRGWQITAEYPGNDYDISGSWEIQRSSKLPSLFIDFIGFDDMETLPMDRSYACQVRGVASNDLYFRKQRSQHLWAKELPQLIAQLDTLYTQMSLSSVEQIL